MIKGYTLIYLPILAIVVSTLKKPVIFPKPKYVYLQPQQYALSLSNSCVQLSLKDYTTGTNSQSISSYFEKIKQREINLAKCPNIQQEKSTIYEVNVIEDKNITSQGYKIMLDKDQTKIYAADYSGFVYGLQTFSQLINQQKIYLGLIEDTPQVPYRGIMIDSVRHFLSYQYIVRLIQVMPIVKLNMLHWHLSDDQAFVLQLINHPQLAKSGAYDSKSFYSLNQMKGLISLAKKNAVSIIPQFDTPAHIRAWGLDSVWKQKDITILCSGGEHYNHLFDISKPQVLSLVSQVLQQVDTLFIDSPYLHLGGDQVIQSCWDLRPSIKNFMKLKNIQNYKQLQMYWRYETKNSLPSSRKVVFWRTKSEQIVTSPQDILQFWGSQSQVAFVASKTQSKLILSPSDILYLNQGQSFIWENQTFGKYFTWKMIYQNFTVFPQGVSEDKILGAEACLWGQVSNQDTFQNNLWPRAAAFGLKVWNSQLMNTSELVQSLINIQKLFELKNIQISPFISQFCENNIEICFGKNIEEEI